nr:ribonuclease H-like domain-containing protein [Tanacetum cinerariifolium]
MRPFGCPVTILNTIDHLGKFDGKADEGFFVRYYLNSKAFRVFNSRTRIVEENFHIRFSESTPNVAGSGPDWLFDIDALTRTIKYEPIVARTQSNDFADPKSSHDDGSKPSSDDGKKVDEDPKKSEYSKLPFDPNMSALEDVSIFNFSCDDEDDGTMADMNNLDTTIQVNHILTTRIHKDHPLDQVIGITTAQVYVSIALIKVGYQGVVDKVSAFYTKNLAQPWKTMFKVFNRCLTTRTFGHDQTKINILQMFHVVINRINVDYAALLWWNFMNNCVNYWDVHVRGMLILDAFLTEEICATVDFKEYETVFITVDFPISQPQLVVSTQGTHRSTPRTHRTPTLTTSPQMKKRKQSAKESSSPRQSYKITVKRKKPSTTPIPPPSDDRERHEIAKATFLSLTLHKTALAAEAQENIAKVQEKLAEEEIEKMVEGDEDEESYASEFADLVLNDDVDNSGTRLEPGSHKENPEKKDDVEIEKEKKDRKIEKEKNNDNVDETDKFVNEKGIVDDVTGSTEIKKEQKQTPIPSPTRSPRNLLSYDKTFFEELIANVSPTTATTSKASSITKCKKQSISFRSKTLPGITCEDEAKMRNFKAKMKTFEEYNFLLLYAVSSNEDTAYQRQLSTRNA